MNANARRRQIADAHIAELVSLGFDQTSASGSHVRPACSQCASLVINGIACHELMCPHVTHECKGCNARLKGRARYCPDCQ